MHLFPKIHFIISCVTVYFSALRIDWRDGRAAEGAPLLREYGITSHRGFESLSLRQLLYIVSDT